MAFDKPTRNRLASFVGKSRDLIADEFTQQFQSLYGISDKGTITPLDQLAHLDDTGLATASLLRERVDYLVKTHPEDREGAKAAVARLAREQAFTVLNRLAAIRMAEKRGLIVESVGKGYQSKGFKVFEQVAGSGLGDTYRRYCRYLFCLFDELAVDLGVLFDRRSPHGLLFPRETALLALFDLLNSADLDSLWAEDETIGWVYQYYNDPAERKKMREHAAPRNSRELAVRNQFFTPRYVVEFLTDNTLGRIWYEMKKGETSLAVQCRYLVRRPTEVFLNPGESAPVVPERQGLSQEELLKQPVYIPHRQVKDPRELRMLDPACGSMHFGLYAFDLYVVIYEEAWEMGMESLRGDFLDKETFLCEVPRLIIEHNIHGIDIDPRAAQIAGLSLWLRAQKSWQAQKVPAAKRPRITRSNIVCAEPMPGEKELLREFTTSLEVPALGYLVEQVFDKMQLAGEAGSLLKIEEEIRDIIAEAKRRWQEVPKLKQMGLFGHASINHVQTELPLDFSGITDERFWEGAEEKVYQALLDYSEVAGEHGYQRRLFAEDAARGFAFIDLCRKRYDVVLMNPPFGDSTEIADAYLDTKFKLFSNNLLCSFVVRGRYLASGGAVGAITDSTWLKKADYKDFRDFMLTPSNGFRSLVDLGWGVLDDANVASCCFTSVASSSAQQSLISVRSADVSLDQKDSHILTNVIQLRDACEGILDDTFIREIDFFEKFPGGAIAYETPDFLVPPFIKWHPLEPNYAITRRGYTPGDTFRFFRCWWEIPCQQHGEKWWTLNNGGAYAPIIGDGFYVAYYEKEWSSYRPLSGFRLESENWFGKAGLGWGKRTDFMYAYPLPARSMFSNEGHCAFPTQERFTWPLIAYLNSTVGQTLLNLYCGQHKLAGYVSQLPTPDLDSTLLQKAGSLAKEAWCELASILSRTETIETFVGTVKREENPDAIASQYVELAARYESQLSAIDTTVAGTIDENCSTCFGSFLLATRPKTTFSKCLPTTGWVDESLSYAVGIALGRWDIRFATGERKPPELPDPFAALPICPPGMLQNANGLPAEPQDVPTDYQLRISWPGILVDDENHPEDIVARVEDALKVIWNDRWEAIEHEACELLGVKTLRDYFRRPSGFFADHLKRYSKSRRQAPIYWPLSTAKGSYTLWIYYHRLTDQTLHTALADFVDPKLKFVRAEISVLRESGAHRDRLEELLDLEKELADFHTEIERIIKLPWKPNLNDGVLITASPMWKLFRLPKWQKDLKACWEKLEKGDYVWAHLAYSIWPKRVEDVCRNDRSIAIAHGLEHLCQVEPPKQKGTRGRKKAVQTDFDEMGE